MPEKPPTTITKKMAEMQRDHWTPFGKSMESQYRTLAMCRLPRCAGDFYEAMFLEPKKVITPSEPLNALPVSFEQPRLIIWYQKECRACQDSRAMGLFASLRAHAEKQTPPFTVHEVEATAELIERFKHVTRVPLYDIVTPDPMGQSVYGAGTKLVTVPNDHLELKTALPGFVFSPMPLPPK